MKVKKMSLRNRFFVLIGLMAFMWILFGFAVYGFIQFWRIHFFP